MTRVLALFLVVWSGAVAVAAGGQGASGSQSGAGSLPAGAQDAAPAAPLEGRTLFADKGCTHCHGENLAGTEKGPSLVHVGSRLDAASISRQIHEGGQNMPAFGDVLDDAEIRALVTFLESQKAPGKRRHK